MNSTSLKSMFNYFNHSWKKRGVIYSIKVVLSELWFDYKFGTETIGLKSLDNISDVSDQDKQGAVHYQASYVYNFKQFFEEISHKVDFDKTFIDMGSGKGRAMMLAALTGFKNVKGVEFSKELCGLAEGNLQNFSKKFDADFNYEVINANAKIFEFSNDISLLYMANPFGEEIISNVLDNVEKSLAQTPRKFLIVYFNPLHEKCIREKGWKVVEESYDPSGQILFKAFEK